MEEAAIADGAGSLAKRAAAEDNEEWPAAEGETKEEDGPVAPAGAKPAVEEKVESAVKAVAAEAAVAQQSAKRTRAVGEADERSNSASCLVGEAAKLLGRA